MKRRRDGEPRRKGEIMRLESNGDIPQENTRQSSRPFSNGSGSNGSVAATPVKASSNHANGLSSNGDSNGTTNGHASTRPTGPFFGHDREEVTRILIQSLTDLGYNGAAGTLSRESGFELENPSVAAFRNAVQEGEWAEAETLLFGVQREEDRGGVDLKDNSYDRPGAEWLKTDNTSQSHSRQTAGLPLAEGANSQEMLFWIKQQKYLELLEQRDLGAALMVLRQELTPLHQNTDTLHALSRYLPHSLSCCQWKITDNCSLIMCQSADDLRRQAEWDGYLGESRSQLLSELSSMSMRAHSIIEANEQQSQSLRLL